VKIRKNLTNGFLGGHGFSRAEKARELRVLTPEERTWWPEVFMKLV